MKTLLFFESAPQSIPQISAWHLADLGEYLGKQKLYERQAPQCSNLCRKTERLNVSDEGPAHYGGEKVIPLKEGNNYMNRIAQFIIR